MSRPSAEVRVELDALDSQRCAIDEQITGLRKTLHDLNQRVPALEREFQAAVAREQQAEIASGDAKP